MTISTGVYVPMLGVNPTRVGAFEQYREGEPMVLFAPGGFEPHSRPVCVGPNEVVTVSAYNLPSGTVVEAWQLVLTPSEIVTVAQCSTFNGEMPPLLSAHVRYAKMMKDGYSPLVLTSDFSEMAIEGPGCFQLRVSDSAALALLYVEVSRVLGASL